MCVAGLATGPASDRGIDIEAPAWFDFPRWRVGFCSALRSFPPETLYKRHYFKPPSCLLHFKHPMRPRLTLVHRYGDFFFGDESTNGQRTIAAGQWRRKKYFCPEILDFRFELF
jgi:hypothetical protein